MKSTNELLFQPQNICSCKNMYYH